MMWIMFLNSVKAWVKARFSKTTNESDIFISKIPKETVEELDMDKLVLSLDNNKQKIIEMKKKKVREAYKLHKIHLDQDKASIDDIAFG